MTTAKPFQLLLPALALFLACAAWPAGAERYPLRQIDRPLVLPAKMWQERLVQNSVIDLEDDDPGTETETLQGFWPTLPSYSFTDRLMWMAIPAPYFRFLLVGNALDSAHGMAARGLSLAVEGGLTGFAYSSRDGYSLVGGLDLVAKRPFSSRIWGEGLVGLSSGWNSDKADANVLSGSAGAGFQLSERFHLKPLCGIILPLEDPPGFLAYGTLEAGVNFTPNLSLGLQVTTVAGSTVWLNPGANLAFQW